jgi:hypothetical protein
MPSFWALVGKLHGGAAHWAAILHGSVTAPGAGCSAMAARDAGWAGPHLPHPRCKARCGGGFGLAFRVTIRRGSSPCRRVDAKDLTWGRPCACLYRRTATCRLTTRRRSRCWPSSARCCPTPSSRDPPAASNAAGCLGAAPAAALSSSRAEHARCAQAGVAGQPRRPGCAGQYRTIFLYSCSSSFICRRVVRVWWGVCQGGVVG